MRFSIAVPSLNQGRFLAACLSSIAAQTNADFEVLIADGGSTDESLGVIDGYTDADPRFRLVSTRDRGHGDAVKSALGGASGDVLAFLNADDLYLTPNVLSSVGAMFRAHPDAAIVSGSGTYIDDEGRKLRRVRLRYHPLDGQHLMRYRTALLQPATFWRREVMIDVPIRVDAEYSFDSWFFYDAWHRGFRILETSERLAGYRLHSTNKSLSISAERVGELARFEDHKFGAGSLRGRYLRAVQRVIGGLERAPRAAGLKRAARVLVNSVSFATVYRLPGI